MKWFALIDCNSFYCSCERLFRPDLRNHPVGVLSNNDGCFISRTPELKALGVPMGAPYFQHQKVCTDNNVAIFSANFAFYSKISARIMSILPNFSPEVEVYSIDEAFLSLDPSQSLFEQTSIIKKTVERWVGVPVSIGVARTKTLAKAANYYAKKQTSTNGICILETPEQENHLLNQMPVSEVWGIGRKSGKKLTDIGIIYANDLRDFSNTEKIKKILTIVGYRTQQELRGTICHDINLVEKPKKSIVHSRSFGQKIKSKQDLEQAIANFTASASEKLRKQNSSCERIGVFLIAAGRQSYVKEAITIDPTYDTRKLLKLTNALVSKYTSKNNYYIKAGVALMQISSDSHLQQDLFSMDNETSTKNLMHTLDKINQREGEQILKFALCALKKPAWSSKQNKLSPRFMHGWNQLPMVK